MGTYRDGQRWRRGHRRAWLVLRTHRGEAVQFDGPVLELLTESRTRFDRRLGMLGPDILAPELDEQGFLRRLRADDREALAIVRAARPGVAQSALDGMQDAHRVVYGAASRPCPRCGSAIRSRGQGDDNRLTYWCAGCQS